MTKENKTWGENLIMCGPELTKREWFAGMALMGFISKHGDMDNKITRSYEIADAMVIEGNKK